MPRAQTIASRFREVILQGTWIANTNFYDQLHTLEWEKAVKKNGSLNSIADLAQHIHYYIAGILAVMKGGPLSIRDQYSFSFPVITSQAQWEGVLHTFWKDANEFATLLEEMPDEQLEEVFSEPKYGTYLRNMEGMIEHSYYHLGQVVLLKKMIEREGE
ncbi:MAG: DUF1572 domain-containing protein [Bacteroidetes bacterium]|nr:DUF1572 domain-containing protein [Bacteroidota bacterium]MBP6314594.1 DUF1572 domain-containing protein [Chitinophagaceae bacterium]